MATPRQQLADALRQARADAGYLSQRDLARRLHVSRPLISRAENAAEAVPSPALIAGWAEATGADVDALNDLARRARSPRSLFVRWSTDFEQRATLIRWFELNLIPGLLQTENYARSLVTWKPFRDQADATLSDRLARQPILDRVELRVLILGSVLHRVVGSAPVMAEQIGHLLAMGERPSVTIQVVPDTPDVAGGLGGAFRDRQPEHIGYRCLLRITRRGQCPHGNRCDRASRAGVGWVARVRATVESDAGIPYRSWR
jgi:transcriptional regulator with XRE-family HTH domain